MAANGSWGDVLPFVAVAHGLTERGHHVEFVLPGTIRGLEYADEVRNAASR
jgi:UDP:flavonoid glycosyltransferase YjiC (YdhE family)